MLQNRREAAAAIAEGVAESLLRVAGHLLRELAEHRLDDESVVAALDLELDLVVRLVPLDDVDERFLIDHLAAIDLVDDVADLESRLVRGARLLDLADLRASLGRLEADPEIAAVGAEISRRLVADLELANADADDADRDRIAAGADRRDPLADLGLLRRLPFDRLEPARLDLEEGDVVRVLFADDGRVDLLAVLEDDLEIAVEFAVLGEDQAVGLDDDAEGDVLFLGSGCGRCSRSARPRRRETP